MHEIQRTCRAKSQQQKSPGIGRAPLSLSGTSPGNTASREAYSPDNRGRNDQNESRL
jgi:hypothetical protein